MSSATFRLASQADDEALRRLLRENPIPGAISLSYEREPDYFIGAATEGVLSQTIIGIEDETAECRGMGTRVIRPMHLNGIVQAVGYMSHLRMDSHYPWGLSLARWVTRGFQTFRELHADGRVPYYLMSIIADNIPAHRLLTSDLPGMPHARKYARMLTYVVSPRHIQPVLPPPKGIELARGTCAHIPEMIACLERNGQRRQFCPTWRSEDLFSPTKTPNLHPEDFLLAVRGSHMVGCLALWDQTSFKQTVVRGYQGTLGRWRSPINLLARFIDIPHLPPPGMPLSYCFASHLAIDNDDPRIFQSLLRAAYNETIRRGFDYFMIGLAEANPLRAALTKSYLHLTYPSQVYLMAWDDGVKASGQVDEGVLGLEIADL
jgi:hypothetical protein